MSRRKHHHGENGDVPGVKRRSAESTGQHQNVTMDLQRIKELLLEEQAGLEQANRCRSGQEPRRHPTGFPLRGLTFSSVERSRSCSELLCRTGPPRVRNHRPKRKWRLASQEDPENWREEELAGTCPAGGTTPRSQHFQTKLRMLWTTTAGEDKC